VELADVRRALPRDAVLIDFAQVGIAPKHRYAAWTIPPEGKGEVRLFDLGEADTLDAIAAALHQVIQKSPEVIAAKGESVALKDIEKLFHIAARRLIQPFLKEIEPYPRCILCPEGELWRVPWAALPIAEGQYLCEKHVLSFVISGRDLVANRQELTTSAPLI